MSSNHKKQSEVEMGCVNLIQWEELSDVVLCGHSYAGSVIAGVADQIPDRIRALVFLDGFVLENGESFMDVVPSEVAQALCDQAKATGDGWKSNSIPAHTLGVRNPEALKEADGRMGGPNGAASRLEGRRISRLVLKSDAALLSIAILFVKLLDIDRRISPIEGPFCQRQSAIHHDI